MNDVDGSRCLETCDRRAKGADLAVQQDINRLGDIGTRRSGLE